MASKQHGGARPGAGRKPRSERFARPIAAAEKRVADRLPTLVDNLFELADGGYQRVTEEWEPAGLLLVEQVLRDAAGNPVLDAKGEPVRVKQPAFPDREAADLVLVKRRTEVADRDRAANIYLVDRILGKPVQAVEASGPDGQPIPVAVTEAIGRVYGDPDPAEAAEGD